MQPANDWCQRWSHRQHSWRHKDEGGFNADTYAVLPIDVDTTAKSYVTTHHYSGSYVAAKRRYGLYTHDDLVGVAVYSIPTQALLLTKTFPELRPFNESVELGRFVLDDDVPANAESWFLARTFEYLVADGFRGVVSCSDPVPRVINGNLTFPGHVGTIYQATNAVYTGRTNASTKLLLPNGHVLNNKSVGKVLRQERGHAYVERNLIQWGARTPCTGENMRAWLHRALEDIGVTRVRHRGQYRYAFPLGNKRARRDIQVGYGVFPYPKEVDRAA